MSRSTTSDQDMPVIGPQNAQAASCCSLQTLALPIAVNDYHHRRLRRRLLCRPSKPVGIVA